jgi:hypothetical protein
MNNALRPRTQRIERMMALVNALYGPDGSIEPLLREVRRGPLRPVDVFPSATVSDGGQRGGGPEAEDSVGLVHAILVTLHIAADFEHMESQREWEGVIEDLRDAVLADAWAGCAVIAVRYIRDDQAEAVFLSGAANAVAEIEFEFDCFDLRGRIGTGDVETPDAW